MTRITLAVAVPSELGTLPPRPARSPRHSADEANREEVLALKMLGPKVKRSRRERNLRGQTIAEDQVVLDLVADQKDDSDLEVVEKDVEALRDSERDLSRVIRQNVRKRHRDIRKPPVRASTAVAWASLAKKSDAKHSHCLQIAHSHTVVCLQNVQSHGPSCLA